MQSVLVTINVVRSNPTKFVSDIWLAGRWVFFPGAPVSSTNKTDRHDITEILLKVALNTINKTSSGAREFTSLFCRIRFAQSVVFVRCFVDHCIVYPCSLSLRYPQTFLITYLLYSQYSYLESNDTTNSYRSVFYLVVYINIDCGYI